MMKYIFIVIFILSGIAQIFAQSTLFASASSSTISSGNSSYFNSWSSGWNACNPGSSGSWLINPGNGDLADSSSNNMCTDALVATFSFNLTSNNAITGIALNITGSDNSPSSKSCDLIVTITKGGTPSPNPTLGNQGACSNIFKPTTTTFYYGSSTQLWGFSSWLPSDLSNIQVVFQGQPQKSPASFYIQAIQLAVYYTMQTTAQQTTTQQTTAHQVTTSQQTTAQRTTVQQATPQQTTIQQTTAQQTTIQQTTAQQTTILQATTLFEVTTELTTEVLTTEFFNSSEVTTQAQVNNSVNTTSKHSIIPIIIGVVVAIIVLLLIICIILLLIVARRRRKPKNEEANTATQHSVSQIFQVMNEHELKRRASQEKSSHSEDESEKSDKTPPKTTVNPEKSTSTPTPTPNPNPQTPPENEDETVSSDELSGVFEEILQTIDKDE